MNDKGTGIAAGGFILPPARRCPSSVPIERVATTSCSEALQGAFARVGDLEQGIELRELEQRL